MRLACKSCQEEFSQSTNLLISGRLSSTLRLMADLNPTQRAILNAIARAAGTGMPPTVRELAEQLDMKRSTVHYHLQALRRAGYLTGEGRHRDIALTDAALDAAGKSGLRVAGRQSTARKAAPVEPAGIPILGRVAAGTPILAAENHIGELSLGAMFDRKGPLFALEVTGDSMIEDGIHEGDYAIVRQQPTATPGDTVIAMIADGEEGEATIKRYREDRGAVVLEPANAAYRPLRFEGAERDRLQILGKLIGLVRRV
jgi:repressor LexA